MANALSTLRELFAGAPLLVGDVAAVSGQTVTVSLPDGAQITARGTATVGQRVFVRGGVVEGTAPAGATVNIDV